MRKRIKDFGRELLKCPKCKSPMITHTLDFNSETGESKVTLTCNDCGYSTDGEIEDGRRFVLSDRYEGNATAPITDRLLHPEYDKMFYTEIVVRMNDLHNECKSLWEENRELRKENEWLKKSNKALGKLAFPMQRYGIYGEDNDQQCNQIHKHEKH